MRKILVVDDDPQMAKLIEMSLSPHGFRIITAQDGEDALQKALQNPPDLIIADIMMPRMDGPTFISELWAKLNNRSIPVIFVTGLISKAEEEVQHKLFGNQYFLAKPFTPSVLKSLVGQVLK